jgi:hypothetical protein
MSLWCEFGNGLTTGTRPANKLRASKESTLKGTQTKLEPGLAGFPY